MNKNHLKIINTLLLENKSIQEMSHDLNISERTLANYAGKINETFEDNIHITKKHGYYMMTVFDEESFNNDLEKLSNEIKKYGEETDKRNADVFQILINNDVSTIDDISEKLYLSKSLIHNIITEIKSIVSEYNVEIKGKPNVGLIVKGSEFNIRKILLENFPDYYKKISLSQYCSEFIKNIKKLYKLDEDTITRIVTALKVTMDRLDSGYQIDENLNIDDQVFQSKDYKNFEMLSVHIEKEYDADYPNYELLLVVLQLFGRRASVIDETIGKDDDKLIQRLIEKTIEDINDLFTIKINEGLFSRDIRLHLKYLIDRLLFDVKVSNETVSDVRQRFPFAYELSKVLAENIEKETKVKVPINELDFLSIYFSIFLDELEQKMKNISSVAIITNQGLSTSRIITVNLRHILNDNVEIEVFTLEEADETLIDYYDLIISTTQTNRLFNKVLYVEDVLDRQLLKLKIEQFLVYKDVNNVKLFNQSILFDYLSAQDIYHIDGASQYYEVIKFLADELVDEKKVEPEFIERILDKEKGKPTINSALGFPHTIHSLNEIQIKLAIIDNALDDHDDIKVIILMAIPEKNVNEAVLIRLYEEVLSLAANNYLMNTINEKTGFRELAHILNQEMRK